MTNDDIQKLRDLPIEGVAEQLGLEVSRHKALCPFHADKHPSLTFNTRKNTCRCYVCMKEPMGTIDLAMKALGKDFTNTCRWLADEHNIIIEHAQKKFNNSLILDQKKEFKAELYARFFEHPWLSPEACHFLFDERKLDPRVIHWCRLNSYKDRRGIHWLQIPYYDRQGRLIGVQSRNLAPSPSEEGQEEAPRFRFPYGSRCSIYNLPVLNRLRPDDDLWIAEGCSDCWAHLSAGHKCIAIPSATLLKPEDMLPVWELASRLGLSLKMYPDHDLPGETLYHRLLGEAIQRSLDLVRCDLPNGCKDYAEYYKTLSRDPVPPEGERLRG